MTYNLPWTIIIRRLRNTYAILDEEKVTEVILDKLKVLLQNFVNKTQSNV